MTEHTGHWGEYGDDKPKPADNEWNPAHPGTTVVPGSLCLNCGTLYQAHDGSFLHPRCPTTRDVDDEAARRNEFWRSKMIHTHADAFDDGVDDTDAPPRDQSRADVDYVIGQAYGGDQGRYRDASNPPQERTVIDDDTTPEAKLINALGFVPTGATAWPVDADGEPFVSIPEFRQPVPREVAEVYRNYTERQHANGNLDGTGDLANDLFQEALDNITIAASHLQSTDQVIDDNERAEYVAAAHAHAALAQAQLEARKALL